MYNRGSMQKARIAIVWFKRVIRWYIANEWCLIEGKLLRTALSKAKHKITTISEFAMMTVSCFDLRADTTAMRTDREKLTISVSLLLPGSPIFFLSMSIDLFGIGFGNFHHYFTIMFVCAHLLVFVINNRCGQHDSFTDPLHAFATCCNRKSIGRVPWLGKRTFGEYRWERRYRLSWPVWEAWFILISMPFDPVAVEPAVHSSIDWEYSMVVQGYASHQNTSSSTLSLHRM